MTPMTINQQFEIAPFKQPSMVAKAFHLQAPNMTHCFVLIKQETDDFDETEQKYHIVFISGESRKIYDYTLCVETDIFENNLFNMLKKSDAKTCFATICQHGLGIVSERVPSIQMQLAIHNVDNIQREILNALNATIIENLQRLHLKIIPRIYNWLAEVSGETYLKRVSALFDYPILLIPNVSPLVVDDMISGELSDIDMSSEQTPSRIITEAIDQGLPLEPAIEAALGIPAYLIPSIKGKRYWEVTAEQHPWSYPQFQENIECYGFINTF